MRQGRRLPAGKPLELVTTVTLRVIQQAYTHPPVGLRRGRVAAAGVDSEARWISCPLLRKFFDKIAANSARERAFVAKRGTDESPFDFPTDECQPGVVRLRPS